jgi:hypothetical protein
MSRLLKLALGAGVCMGAVAPFFSLLALCARGQGHPAQAALLREHAGALQHWHPLPVRAEAHGLAPLIYTHLQAAGVAVPPTIKQELLGYYMQHAHAARMRTQVLSDILTCYQAAGIDALVLKGAALAHLVYEQPVLRPMRDIDCCQPVALIERGAGAIETPGRTAARLSKPICQTLRVLGEIPHLTSSR